MSKWPMVRIRDIATEKGLVGGPFGSSLGSSDYVPNGVPVIRGINLASDGRFNSDEFVFVSPEKAEKGLHRNLAEPGDVVFTQRGTLGQVGIVPSDHYDRYVISQSQMRLRVERSIAVPEYIYYCFRMDGMIAEIRSHAITTGVPHINLGILAGLQIPLPPLGAQRSTVRVLGALEDKVVVNDRMISTAEKLAATLAGHIAPKSLVPLSNLVEHRRDQVTPSELAVDTVAHYSIPSFDKSCLPELVSPKSIKSAKFSVEDDVVLLSKLNSTTPRVWRASPRLGSPAVASTEFLVLGNRTGIGVGEIWAVCSDPAFWEELVGKATGTSNSHQRVRPSDLLATEVVDPRTLPPDIRSQIDVLCALATQARLESRQLTKQRDTLLPGLMSGEIRVREAERAVEEAT